MRKFLLYFLLIVLLLLAGAAGYFYYLADSRVPLYEGEHQLPGLESSVEVSFDAFGIPHIKGERASDVYHAFGYLVASERLFQMEMIRRLGKGELAEVFGERAVESDRFFRTVGIGEHAKRSAYDLQAFGDSLILEECEAFLSGINRFIEEGEAPLEFVLAGIPLRRYELDDLYTLAGYMAWSFALAVQTDLLATELSLQHPVGWLEDMGLDATELGPFTAPCNEGIEEGLMNFPDFFGAMGVPAFQGSNAWALAPSKTENGKAMLCNDTHIGYGIPQVWYEASLQWPGAELYGNFIPGIPYALVGHSYGHSWGLTMFENDDIDFYREYPNEDGLLLFDESSYEVERREEVIKVKGEEKDIELTVKLSRHGPIINDVIPSLSSSNPVSMRWEYVQGRNRLLEAFRGINFSPSLEAFQRHLPLIHAPGLNVIYADSSDNIARWSCARLPIRPQHVNPKTVIDGSRSRNEITGFLPFDRNPQCVNPPSGFVHSANEQPDAVDSLFVPGYYVPPSRAKRISKLLDERNSWNAADMKTLLLDVVNEDDAMIAAGLYALLQEDADGEGYPSDCMALLQWDGSYAADASSPVLFQALQVRLLASGMRDKMSPEQFDRFCKTHWMRRLLIIALSDPRHKVWDISTTSEVEDLSHHLRKVFPELCEELKESYGDEPGVWRWGSSHTWGPSHPLKDIPLIGNWLSLEERPMAGSNETISQSGYYPSGSVKRKAHFGAQMRIVLDFSDVDASESVTPVGQSGHRLSPHYSDQVELYASGRFRPQSIQAPMGSKTLVLKP